MSTIQIQCKGCNKHFTPRGLSQHISKTQRPSCRADYTTSQTPSTAIPHAVAPLDSIDAPCVSGADNPCDDSDESNSVVEYGGLNPIDPADVVDADALEALSQGNNFPTVTNPDQRAVDAILEDPDEGFRVNLDDSDAETTSTVTVERFPFGSPGAPIPGRPPGPSTYESQVTLAASVWAPFRSQCDWELARWAKMRSPTSSAMTDLLAIPTVRLPRHHFIASSNPPTFRL